MGAEGVAFSCTSSTSLTHGRRAVPTQQCGMGHQVLESRLLNESLNRPSDSHLGPRRARITEWARGLRNVVPREDNNIEHCYSTGDILRLRRVKWACQAGPDGQPTAVSPSTKCTSNARTVDQIWKEYFADPSQWWDNRAIKRNAISPDFKHKVTKKVLWVDGWSTPSWVKAKLLLITQEKVQAYVCHRFQPAKDVAQLESSLMKNRNPMDILHSCDQQGIALNSNDYGEILQRCCKMKDLVGGKQVHDHIIKSGLEQSTYVANHLLRMYAKCGKLEHARQVFDNLQNKDGYSWTFMLGGYAEHDYDEEAFEIYYCMVREGVQPNRVIFLSILNACSKPEALKQGKEVHAHIQQNRIQVDVSLGTALVNMYAKCGSIKEARQVFDSMVGRDVISWTVIIKAYADIGHGKKAYEQFLQMQKEGFAPNAATYLSILNPCASAGSLEWVKQVHTHALKAGLDKDVHVGNALVNMYAKSGSLNDARLLFDSMLSRNVISWTVIVGAYAERGHGNKAYKLFLQMQQEGFAPNIITYLSILNPCASVGALAWVKEVHAHAVKAGLDLDVHVGNALVHMYAKSGSLSDARLVFDSMPKRNVISWTVMIGGLAQHGCGQEALLLFEEMKVEGVRPDEVTFVALLSACSHAGLVGKGWHYFSLLSQDFGIQPTVVHYCCMVDILGRAGQLVEAVSLIRNMQCKADAMIWRALLGACRTYGDVKLAEYAAQKCLMLEPGNAAVYVVLSNIYAAAGLREKASSVQIVMKERGVKKEPACSWIEIDNKIHCFVVGDKSHPEAEEIYAELRRLTTTLKRAGYVPETRLVMHDVDEQQKEEVLCSHSEKLAIAYGLIKTPPKTLIRLFKNLRVCSDCHTASKFISKVTGREIVARDGNRFHHFKDGVCSCGDYW